MNASFRGVPIQTNTVGITRQPVHDGPADATRLVDLEAEVIVCAGNRVIMLVNDKVRTVGASRVRGV